MKGESVCITIQMTKNFYTDEYINDYSTYGGIIYNSDFGAYRSLKDITDRIISDRKFDKSCKKATVQNKKYFNEQTKGN